MRFVRATVPAGVAVVTVLLPGCDAGPTAEPFVIGYVASFSGDLSGAYDRVALLGAEYEAARLNSQGGIRGRPIEIVVADIADSAAAFDAADALVEAGVDALFVAPFPDLAAGAVEIGTAANLPVLSVAGTIPSIAPEGSTAYLNAFGDNVQASAAAEVAIEAGHRTAMLVTTPDIAEYGDRVPLYFAEAFADRGGSIVASIDVDLDETSPFDRVVAELGSLSDPPDVVYTAIYSPWLNDLLDAVRTSGYSGLVIGADGAETDALFDAGPEADGMLLTTHAFSGSRATVDLLFAPESPAERIARFVRGFESYHGRPPASVSFAALGADAVGVLHAAANRGGSSEPEAILEAIADLDRVQVTTGRITYRGQGAVPVKVVYVLEVDDGEFRLHDVVEPDAVPPPVG